MTTQLLTSVKPDKGNTHSALGGIPVTKADSLIEFPTTGDAWKRPRPPRGFSVGDAGSVKITMWDGSVLEYVDGELAIGVVHPLAVIQIWATGTNATRFKVYW